MKTILIVGGVLAALLVVSVAALGVFGYAYAQTATPGNGTTVFGPGMMGRWNNSAGPGMMGRWQTDGAYGPGGMMGQRGSGAGPMHQYMVNAFAEALGTTPEDLQAQLDAGETMWSVAEAKGMTLEEFSSLMLTARTEALDQAVADGVLTQEQADWMTQRMAQAQAAGYGPGNCPMHGGAFQAPVAP
ncbi:MAG: hypothetical protein L0Z70_10675 [Chloroflexi bacterium]|nr:hypothetical protein [Chloroflexota bacterium]